MAVNRCRSGFGRRNIRRLVENDLPFLIAFFKRRATVPAAVRYAFQNIITGVCAKTLSLPSRRALLRVSHSQLLFLYFVAVVEVKS